MGVSIDDIANEPNALQSDKFFTDKEVANNFLTVESPDLTESSNSQDVLVSMGFDR